LYASLTEYSISRKSANKTSTSSWRSFTVCSSYQYWRRSWNGCKN
jgi:hypothetical protein